MKLKVKKLGEEIENSFAIGEDGVYIVSDKRMYRFAANANGKPRIVWKKRYPNSGIVKPSQVNAGSGTTPTLMDNGYVAITDNADPMNVIVYRRERKLHGAKREVCRQPVFEPGASATENSLITAGRSLIVENNYGYQDPFGPGLRRGHRAGRRPRRREQAGQPAASCVGPTTRSARRAWCRSSRPRPA